MEFQLFEVKAESTRALLRRQVEEQSELCDFTLKMGNWSRRYHRCVLNGSPFFQCLIDGKFKEKSKGCVEIAFGSPASLEGAILFLYGKYPKLDMANISDLLNFAEYFLLPNLKSFCVRWIRSLKVTKENFCDLLQMSSLFDFEHFACYNYVKEHMNECFEIREFLFLTKESVEILYADKKLAYVSADAKFTFLLKWAKRRGTQGEQDMFEVLSLMNLSDVSPKLIEEANDDNFLKNSKIVCYASTRKSEDCTCTVLIKKAPSDLADFWVFDISGKNWYRLDVQIPLETNRQKYFSKSASDSVLYSTRSRHQGTSVFLHNMELGTVTETNLIVKSDHGCYALFLKKNSGLAIACETVYIAMTKSVKETTSFDLRLKANVERRIALMFQKGASLSEVEAFSAQYKHLGYSFRSVTVLYKGLLQTNGEATLLQPLISFPKKVKESTLCVNNSNMIAMFDYDNNLFLYDIVTLKLDILYLRGVQCDYRLCPSDMGFVAYNSKSVICLTKNNEPNLFEKYQASEIDIQRNESINLSYKCVGNMWIRCACCGDDEKNVCEYALHEDILASQSFDTTKWTPLNYPDVRDCFFNIEYAAMITLPRSLLKCHIECPHCDRIRLDKNEEAEKDESFLFRPSVWRDTDDDNDSSDPNNYDDSSDPNYYDDSSD